MNDGETEPALREWRDHMLAPATLAVLVGVSIILSIIVPFETDRFFNPMQRFGYWVLITTTTYSAGALINGAMSQRWRRRIPLLALIAASCAATGIAITVLVTVINFALIGYVPALSEQPVYLGSIFAIAFVVAGLFHVLTQQTLTSPPRTVRVLDRVAFDKRGALLALSVEDHYVRITTTKGTDVVLMRLRDALLETGDVAGMQVHRSHWIALNALKSVKRNGDGALITLTNGDDVPVSRRYMPAIKKAGLLAR